MQRNCRVNESFLHKRKCKFKSVVFTYIVYKNVQLEDPLNSLQIMHQIEN